MTIKGGTLALTYSDSAGYGDIAFAPRAHATIYLAGGAAPTNTISGLDALERFDLQGFDGSATATIANDLLIVTEGGLTKTLHLDPSVDYSDYFLRVTSDGNGGAFVDNFTLLADSRFEFTDLSNGAPGVTVDAVRGNYKPIDFFDQTHEWFSNGGVGVFAPTAAVSTAFAGSQVAYISQGHSLSQFDTVAQIPEASGFTEYQFSFDVGGRLDAGPASGYLYIWIVVGSYTATMQVDAADIAVGGATHLSLTSSNFVAAGYYGDVQVNISNASNKQLLVERRCADDQSRRCRRVALLDTASTDR